VPDNGVPEDSSGDDGEDDDEEEEAEGDLDFVDEL
jgi:hypothetical protein